MATTSDNVIGNYNSEELLDLYNQDEEHEAFNQAIASEINDMVGEDGIDEDEQEKIDDLFSNMDEIGSAWNDYWEELDALETGEMTDAEVAEQKGLMESAEDVMDVLEETLSAGEDYVTTIQESTIEIGDDGGSVTADEDTEDLIVQCNGSSDPFSSSDEEGLIYNVTDATDGTNILTEGRIPISIDTPSLTLQSWDGNNLIFTFEAEEKDEEGNTITIQRTITIKDYDPAKYVLYFEGDSITQEMVDGSVLASWPTEILGSSVWSDDTWSMLVRTNGPSAWEEYTTLTGDTLINQAIGYVPEASGLTETIKSSWERLWQGYIDGDVDSVWGELVGEWQGYGEEQMKALVKVFSIMPALDSDLTEFYGTFFDSYGSTLQGLLDVDYENPASSDLLALMTIEEFTTAGASLGGDLYPETLFGSEGFEDMGEVKNPEVSIAAINDLMDISALSGHTYSSYLKDSLEIQEGILEDGGYFNLSDDQYDAMVDQIMLMTAAEGSGLTDTELRNALVQAVTQLQEMGTTTIEDARTNILTIANSFASLGDVYVDDVTAGLLYLLMTADGGSTSAPSAIYESVVADDFTFMTQLEPLINNGKGLPIYYDEIQSDFATRGYEFTEVATTETITSYDTTLDGAIAGMLTGGLIFAAKGGAVGAAIGTLICPGLGTFLGGVGGIIVGGVIGFFVGGMIDKAVEATTTWAANAWDTITFWN